MGVVGVCVYGVGGRRKIVNRKKEFALYLIDYILAIVN